MIQVPIKIYVTNQVKKAREATRSLALLSTATKNEALRAMAELLERREDAILDANRQDVDAVGKTLEGASKDKDTVKEAVKRVTLTAEMLHEIVERLRLVADLPDPVGEMATMWRRANGMQVSRMRVPIGLIGIICEQGPRAMVHMVTLCLKSGNAGVIWGGADWPQSGTMIATLLRETAEQREVPSGGITFLERTEREAPLELIRQSKSLDAMIPRGGTALRRAVMEQSRVPVLGHDLGVSSLYIDVDADLPMAQNIAVNSKVQSAAQPNSVDTMLVHHMAARAVLPALLRRLLEEFKVDVKGCPKTIALTGSQPISGHKAVVEAKEEDWSQQFLSPTLAVKMVKDMDETLEHIARYGPAHTATIVTRDYATAMRFVREVDAGAVMVNASTRLHDGAEFGMGAEIGISTTRLPARGPVSLEELTCQKYVVLGTGQLRQPHPVPVAYEDAIMLKKPLG